MKNIVSAGIVKKDLKGAITGPSSRNFLTNPMEIILFPPSGDYREFLHSAPDEAQQRRAGIQRGAG